MSQKTLLPLLLFAVALAACQPAVTPAPTLPPTQASTPAPTQAPTVPATPAVVIGEALVDSVEIQILESFPVQVQALVRGNLPNGCAQLGEVKQRYEPNEFQVALFTETPTGLSCTQALVPFETAIPLEVTDFPAGHYTVVVNGVRAEFELPGPVETTLPAPLYFLSRADEQIWRVEQDGSTLTQITREAAPVTVFEVSPHDGSLVYVSNNDLIRADASGANRVVLVDSPARPANEFESRISTQITHPVWSPDGPQIAYGLGGVNVIAASGGEPQLIEQSDPLPDFTNNPTRPPVAPEFYWPISWSPDGSRLLIEAAFYPEGSTLKIKVLSNGSLVEARTDGIPCCDPSWSPDGQSFYLANDSMGLVRAGLWRVQAATGETAALIANGDNPPFTRPMGPTCVGG